MHETSLRTHSFLLKLTTILFASACAFAQAGSLDTTFATKGIFQSPNGKTTANSVAIQSDGKIVVTGVGVVNNAFASQVYRLNTNGTLDSSFGSGGVATTAGFGFFGAAIQSDGKIVTASQGLGTFQLVRYNSNGTLDTSFGSGGFAASISIGGQGTPDSGSIALQANGDILVAVGAGNPSIMARYTTAGQLDSTFGTGGLVNLLYPSPTQIVVLPTGKILVASGASGILVDELSPSFVPGAAPGAITRYKSNGSLDTTFAVGGSAASVASASAMMLQSDGKIVVGGALTSKFNTPLSSNNFGFAILRYNANGMPDHTFGRGGLVVTDFGSANNSGAFALAVQANGDIVAAGAAGTTSGSTFTSAFGLARYSSAGVLDTTFGNGGIVITQPDSNASPVSSVTALAIQNDGKIVATGNSAFNFVFELSYVARYLAQ